MDKKQLLAKLAELATQTFDIVQIHYDADQLLLDYIDDPDIEEVYGSIKKWYA